MTPNEALGRLAEHCRSAAVEPAAIGATAVERLGYSLLDLFGCYLAARRLGVNVAVERVARELGGPREATLWGGRRRLPAMRVALTVGTIAHHLELDGGWHGPPGVGVHPAVTILPAAVAVAERTGATGRELVAAAAAGYDVLAAVATWLCPGVTAFKLHPPGLLGGFGAAAAAGRLLGLGASELTGALARVGGMAPLCPFESFTAGASAKDLYGGWPGALGVFAAELPPPDRPGFTLPSLLGRAAVDPADGLAQLGRPALLEADFKPYPTCRSVQPALTALEALLARRPLEPAEVASIAVETYPYAVELDRSADPALPIGARTSIQTCLALRLRHGPLRPEHFSPALLAEPAVRALADATSVEVGRFADRPVRGARLEVTLRDGRHLEQEVAAARWSDEQPATPAELLAKFRDLAGPSLAPADLERLIERTLGVEHLPSVRPLLEILARAAPPDREAATPTPQVVGLDERLRRVEPTIAATVAARGADPAPLLATLAATRVAATRRRLDSAAHERALALALSLAPSGGGPTPPTWPRRLGNLAARLAAHGLGGPPGVLDGPRGLGSLLLDPPPATATGAGGGQ